MKGAGLQMRQSKLLRCLCEAVLPPHRREDASWQHERRYMRLVEPPSSSYARVIVVMMRVKVKLQNRPLEHQSAASLPCSSRSYPARVKPCSPLTRLQRLRSPRRESDEKKLRV